ncbi:restriction endonuclease subunit S [Heyndrickxia faecalis]|uniref:restriction endonuclease subunit S n=1 Tax=Heyndrickxia faecalis TaxID=2824910 RepID=UPI003D1C63A2
MNLKESYPSDWIEYKFDYLFEFEGGMALSRSNLSNEGICYLHYGDIHKLSGNYIDVEKDYDTIPKLNERLEKINEKYILKDGDIVFADASEDYEGIGKSIVVINKTNIPFISGLHTIIARDKSNLLDNSFKRFFLSDWNIRKQIMVIASGISVYGISKENIKNIRTVIPPINEQRKIASILSTWDKAIELKEKLIEQKKLQKKGLMQKLLTGEVRLPGFDGEWKEVYLKNYIQEYSEKSTVHNQFPILTSSRNGLMLQSEYYSNRQVTTDDNVGYNIIPRGYITYRSRSDDGKFVFNKNTIIDYGIVSYFYPVFKFNDKACSDFMLELLNHTIERKANAFVEGTAQKVLSLKKLGTFRYFIPDIEEQEAIADVLMKINFNIKLLEDELKELKKQKKGLMQLLLTGKVRVKM